MQHLGFITNTTVAGGLSMSQESKISFAVAAPRKAEGEEKRSLCCFVWMFLSGFRLFLSKCTELKQDYKLQSEATAFSQTLFPF